MRVYAIPCSTFWARARTILIRMVCFLLPPPLLTLYQWVAEKWLKTYQGPEFRLSARYAFNDDFSVKAGFQHHAAVYS